MEDGGQAFPRPHSHCDYLIDDRCVDSQKGMTLRDYFAGQALSSIMARQDPPQKGTDEMMAHWAYQIADAMIKEREVQK